MFALQVDTSIMAHLCAEKPSGSSIAPCREGNLGPPPAPNSSFPCAPASHAIPIQTYSSSHNHGSVENGMSPINCFLSN